MVVGQQRRGGPGGRRIVHGMDNLLVQVRVHLVEVRLQHIHQRDVEAVLPDAGRPVAAHPVLVPGAVRGEDEVVGAQRHLVAVDDGVGATAFHDEAQRGSRVTVGRGALARVHHLEPGIEPADGSGDVAPPGVVQVDDAAARLLRCDERHRAQDMVAQLAVAPQHGDRLRDRLPRLDLVGDRPQGAGVHRLELAVIGEQLGGIFHVGSAGNVLPVLVETASIVHECLHIHNSILFAKIPRKTALILALQRLDTFHIPR